MLVMTLNVTAVDLDAQRDIEAALRLVQTAAIAGGDSEWLTRIAIRLMEQWEVL